MTNREIVKLLNAKLVCEGTDVEVNLGFASDLMSDVLALCDGKVLLITGLANVQTVRTAEMSGIEHILFVRNKKVTEKMIKIAKMNDMTLMEASDSMFKSCAKLSNAGLKACF